MDKEILEELGLTNAEIKVYIALLKLGSSTAGDIIETSGLQSSVVYRSFNSLIDKGLINFIFEGKRKIYQATKPESFFDFIEEKKRRFAEILPELKKQQNTQEKENAAIFKGVRGIKEAYSIMINTRGKEYLTFGGGPIAVEVMGGITWWMNLHERRIANKLPSRQLFDDAVKDIGGREIARKKMTNIRFLPKEFAQFQETVIVGDTVSINVFSKNPYSFVIKDKNVAEGYKKYFEQLWKLAKK